MPLTLNGEVVRGAEWATEITAEQRTRTLELIRQEPTLGTTTALRRAGVAGSKGHLKQLVDDEFENDTQLARGWDIVKVEGTVWQVALDPHHPHWERAAGRLLRAYVEAFKDESKLEVSGPNRGPIQIEDRSASLADLARVLEAAGALTGIVSGVAGDAVPDARELLAAPVDR